MCVFQFRLYDSNLMFTADSYTYQCQYLYNCAPTPPLTQKQSTDSKLGFMFVVAWAIQKSATTASSRQQEIDMMCLCIEYYRYT